MLCTEPAGKLLVVRGSARWRPRPVIGPRYLAMALLRSIRDALRRFVSSDEGLDVTEYVAAIERQFAVKLAPADIESTNTLRDMTHLVVRKLREGDRADTTDDVWPDLRRITSEQFGVDACKLNPDIRYREDLNC